ncbi:MAG TPA: bifunctional 5,10-methylenetetrahydrofolate dehydrogenase/5,10-methenyltetrahydrofolate cyclohydrolase [Candidatus Paceibacterota bacterium]|nr:bifunctional 5,10-methylenetetrahydrofolate dehydrogenase/5,10-methenyltetrahydrofolate cyclohydrolase [Candidatus Paceibacterota bacterium]
MVIDGRKIAERLVGELKARPKPGKYLAAFLVGENPESGSFLKRKEATARDLGVDFRTIKIPADETLLRGEIAKAATDPDCGGILLQLPLPANMGRRELVDIIPPDKDVDNLTGRAAVLPPAVLALKSIINDIGFNLASARVAVVGLGFLVGGPISRWLKDKCAELHLLDTRNDLEILKEMDLVISGVGQAHLISPAMLKNGSTVIDFGYDVKNGKIYGDFDDSEIRNSKLETRNLTYTPTPGGTGPILVAKLFENFYNLTNNQ